MISSSGITDPNYILSLYERCNSPTETTSSNCVHLVTPFLIKHVWLHFLRLCFLNKDSEPLLKYITQVAWQLNDITTFLKNTSFVSKIFNFVTKNIGGDTWCIYIWRKIMFISCRNINSKIFFLSSLLSIVIMMALVLPSLILWTDFLNILKKNTDN